MFHPTYTFNYTSRVAMCCINNNDVNTSFNQCFHTTWCISTCTYRSTNT
ncbi:Uncharacterised protein [Klebsiella pneumoniae]|nr:Uncharacterised protein [Klebsiella pneumoniae]